MNYTTEFKLGIDGLDVTPGVSNTFEMPEGVIPTANASVYFYSGGLPATTSASYTGNGNLWSFTATNGIDAPSDAIRVEITQGRNFGDDPGLVTATATTRAWNEPPLVTVDQSVSGETKFAFSIPVGKPGNNGISAYAQAHAQGFEGSVDDWLESLKGEAGKSAYEVAKSNGFNGSLEDWLNSLKGANGKSAYELALDAGFKGSYLEYLNSLKGQKGDKGDQGKSAYQVAFDAGFSGTEAEWLESLKAPSTPAVGGYKELANGVLWYCRPRYNTGRCTVPDTGFGAYDYETAEHTTKFVIEDGLFEDHGCYVVPDASNLPTDDLRLRMTRGVNRGIHHAGRMTDRSDLVPPYSGTTSYFIDRWAAKFYGWYYVMLSPQESAQFLADTDLEKIEVDVQPVTFSGVDVTNWAPGGTETYFLAKEQGLLVPIYKGASRHTVSATGETIVALWFRVGVYTHRSNIGSDNHSFDGINGEPDGWNLHDVDVKFWSTNVAQGMKFSAKIRN